MSETHTTERQVASLRNTIGSGEYNVVRQKVRVPLVFRGNASEYFRIWIVNLVLSLFSIGIYSAWAKVRRTRYLYGNTYLDGSSFDYSADPRRILTGRCIAAVLLVSWFIIFQWGPVMVARWGFAITTASYVLITLIAPFFIYKALRFRLSNTRHHGVRFGFGGNLKESFIANGVWLVLGIVSLGLLYPIYANERIKYFTKNSRFGARNFEFYGSLRTLYGTYFLALVIVFLFIIAFNVLIYFITAISPDSFLELYETVMYGEEEAITRSMSVNMVVALLIAFNLVLILCSAFVYGFVKARLTNYTAAHLRLGNSGFGARLSGLMLGTIYVSNLLAILISFGMLGPWAKIRATRYKVERIYVLVADDIDSMVSFDGLDRSAFGEEAAELFDLDFGI